ncbi:MAG TPA: RcpC/CpaB family pilus assembly protein [Acidimicrobiales bacterium]|nr:RcpC/CpaB family pilus assembly protein [Acidimicrobiales bacterium]
MSSRRTLILIAAVVIGAISAYLVFNYVNSADDRAQGNARKVDVLKVAKDIPKGLTGREAQAQGMLVPAQITAEFKPATAIIDSSIIQDKVAVANYATGQILVDGMFADPIESLTTFAGRVPNDCAPVGFQGSTTNKPVPCVGVTISVDQVHGVAGVIVPGDYVNVMVKPENTADCTNSAQVVCSPLRVLYQAARVLFVDKSAVPQPGEVTGNGTSTANPTGTAQAAANTGLITLEVPQKAAQLIGSVASSGIYLSLLPAQYTPEAMPKLDTFPDVLPGEDPNQLTPYGPAGFQSQK